MNPRIQELASKAFDQVDANDPKWFLTYSEKFSELVIQDHTKAKIQQLMSDPEFVLAMDAHYEQKWAHRFD